MPAMWTTWASDVGIGNKPVMRLYKPKLYTLKNPLKRNVPAGTVNNIDSSDVTFALSDALILPDSFGYISVINHFSHSMKNVGLSAKLQTPSVRADLHDMRQRRIGVDPPPNPLESLLGGKSLDMVVEHKLAETGVHTLRVGVTYTDYFSGEQKSLRKFYRFNVLNPINTTFRHTLVKGESFVEATIKNDTQSPLFLDNIVFQANQPFVSQDLSVSLFHESEQHKGSDELLNILESSQQCIVQPEEILQKIYRVYVSNENQKVAEYGATNLGRLEITWNTSFGEQGSIQTQPVVRKTRPPLEVQVVLESISSPAVLGFPLQLHLRLFNHSNRIIYPQLQIRKEAMSGIFCCSLSCQNLEVLASNESQSIALEVIPLVMGLHSLKGVLVVDLQTLDEFVQDSLGDLLVEPPHKEIVGV